MQNASNPLALHPYSVTSRKVTKPPNSESQAFLPSNSSLATVNFSVTTSQASIISSNPFLKASKAVVPVSSTHKKSSQHKHSYTHKTPTNPSSSLCETSLLLNFFEGKKRNQLTPGLNPNIHLRLTRMRNRIPTKLDISVLAHEVS